MEFIKTLWSNLQCNLLTFFMFRKGDNMTVSKLAVNYATLIQEGVYTFDKVPKRYKLDTAIVLVLWECEDLVTDETYLAQAKAKIEENNASK